jgi:hypothetical protein
VEATSAKNFVTFSQKNLCTYMREELLRAKSADRQNGGGGGMLHANKTGDASELTVSEIPANNKL